MKIPKLAPIPMLMVALVSCVPLAAETAEVPFSQAELDQMLAPIALYPDALLSQVLMAATYPLEIVEASRWSRANPELEGDEAVQAVQDQDWDLSVKGLVAFPELIQLMDENLTWTRRLGDAFLLQEQQVMETSQNLRRKSLETGNLDSLAHITVEEQDDVIVIQPTDVEVVYVPYYSTQYVYGDWWWHDYPPYYWGPSYGYYGGIGFHWSHGFRISTSFYYSSCDWHHHRIVINNHHNKPGYHGYARTPDKRGYQHNPQVWRHDPQHRRGVHYRDGELTSKYGRSRSSGMTRVPGTSGDRVQRRGSGTHSGVTASRPDRVNRSDGTKPTARPDNRRPSGGKSQIAKVPSKGNRPPPTKAPGRVTKSNRTNKGDRGTVASKPGRTRPPSKPPPPPVASNSDRNRNSSYSSNSGSRGNNNRSMGSSRPSRSSSGNPGRVPNNKPRKP